MINIYRRSGGLGFFWLAVIIWVLVTFPGVHLSSLYSRHLVGTGSHPELFAAYLRRLIWTTMALSVVGPAILWALPRRLKAESMVVLVMGAGLGLLLTSSLWALLSPAFRWVSERPLDAGNFLYSGLMAGIVVAEVHRRALLVRSGHIRGPSELKRDFYVAALAIWAVLLKVMECIYLAGIQPGPVVVGIHFYMFLSILLWVPWVCKLLWNRHPRTALSSVLRSCAAGVLLPPLVAAILFVPATLLLYVGLRWPYYMLWGGIAVVGAWPWAPLLYSIPGILWGIVTGLLRWRYLEMEKQNLLPLPGPIVPTE